MALNQAGSRTRVSALNKVLIPRSGQAARIRADAMDLLDFQFRQSAEMVVAAFNGVGREGLLAFPAERTVRSISGFRRDGDALRPVNQVPGRPNRSQAWR